ncbi:MAG: short-chain fatty acyl-CoA regulator family protein [Pseudomonadota bacterium]
MPDPTSREKLFAGAQLRQIRAQMGLSQAALAARLNVSPSYMNQLEHDHRPVSATILMGLSMELGVDVGQFSSDIADQHAQEVLNAALDPAYSAPQLEPRVVRHLVRSAPELARLFLASHQQNKRYEERLQVLNAQLEVNPPPQGKPLLEQPLPYDEVRDYFHHADNYIASLDVAAEHLAETHALYGPNAFDRLCAYVKDRHGFSVTAALPNSPTDVIYTVDKDTREIALNGSLAQSTLSFQLAAIIGLTEQAAELDELLAAAGFTTSHAEDICRISLANYFAGALIMPYAAFRQTAAALRHDIEQLQHHFGVSFEQVCHRLSNLQRLGANGVPFFFARVDRAGNITKRHSATKLQFVRYGGTCPLWNVHESFTSPGRVFVQVIETPDGAKYLSIARAIVKRAGRFDGFNRHYAVALGCDISAADKVVYADGIDLTADKNVTPIGVSCRICDRKNCAQRAFPPLDRNFATNASSRKFVPYTLDAMGDKK